MILENELFLQPLLWPALILAYQLHVFMVLDLSWKSMTVVTWFNPQAIIDGTMMLGAFHVTLLSSQALPFMSGIISASFLWFTGLIFVISLFSKIFRGNNSSKVMTVVNRVCGTVIIIYGLNLLKVFFTMLA